MLEKETHKILRDLEIQADHPTPGKRSYLVLINKNRTCDLVDFATPVDPRVKVEENEKHRQILRPGQRTEKKLWNMKVKVIPIVVGALGTVPKGLERGLENPDIRGRIDTIQNTALLQSTRILRRVLDT